MVYTSEFLAVIISAVGSFFIGFLWFGPLFGKKWMTLMQFRQEDIESKKQKGMGGMAAPMALAGVANVVTSFIFFSILNTMGFSNFGESFTTALLVWIGFSIPIFLNATLWEGKPWSLFWLGSTHILASLVFTSLIYSWMV